ncbi:hypothetical protein HNQ91_006068 [Filimonas zeae]|uniref:Uncharacterized protein n=1 Tax=Filimonas zeae TaxID=1737353 RepID=A0A917J7B3_9BACT|nr:hypothetical protein [Filimonas zeae]MDR6342981.1 hypothetical protein [Filimonas zeae]GGH83475.1 hypothetical protein GCM10011379_58920 [Filimonas zeae]
MRVTIFAGLAFFTVVSACYKREESVVSYTDGHSTVIYNLPGDTLASDGWDSTYEKGDTYMRQHYYNASWTDSIRILPWGNEKINAAARVDASSEDAIVWLAPAAAHPAGVANNSAYTNTADGNNYIFRSGVWYQMNASVYNPANDGKFINWQGYAKLPPASPVVDDTYCDSDNQRVYIYNGKAWTLLMNNVNYRSNINFISVQYSRSGKETGRFNMFLFRFADSSQQIIRDAADSARYLKNGQWDLAFTENFNGLLWLNNALYAKNPGFGGPLTKTAVVMYLYGYEFMNEAPPDSVFDAVPAGNMQMGFSSEYGSGVNAWYEYSTATHLAQPFPYRAYYLRLQQTDPVTGVTSYLYGKLQMISMYKGAPEVVTDINWPSPYFTFRYFIQKNGSRNLKTKD